MLISGGTDFNMAVLNVWSNWNSNCEVLSSISSASRYAHMEATEALQQIPAAVKRPSKQSLGTKCADDGCIEVGNKECIFRLCANHCRAHDVTDMCGPHFKKRKANRAVGR